MKPLPDADLKQINDLVKEAMGYNKDRGDTLSVASSPFTASDKTEMDIPLWKDPDILALAKDLFKYGAIAAIIAYLMLKVVMPLIKTMATPPPPPKPAHVGMLGGSVDIVEDSGDAAPPTAAEVLEKKLSEVREFAQQDPKVVANIIKDWTNANAG